MLIWDLFKHHPPKDAEVASKHASTRDIMYLATLQILKKLPDCPERDMFVTKMREAMMWANAAIAIRSE